MLLVAFSLLAITVIANAVLAITVLASLKKQPYKYVFLSVLATVILWAVGDILMLTSDSTTTAYFGAQLFYIAPLFTPVLLWLFAIQFPENSRLKKIHIYSSVVALLLATIPLLINVNFIIYPIELAEPFNKINPRNPGFLLYGLFLIVFFLLVYITLLQKIRTLKGTARLQVLYTYFGVVLSSSLALVTNVAMPLLGYVTYVWLGPPFTLINTIAMFMAMFKYQLFEFKFVVLRLISYTFLILFISVTYTMIVVLLSASLTQSALQFDKNFYVTVIATLLVVFTVGNLRSKFDKYTNKIFFKDAYNSQELINQINSLLVSKNQLHDLIGRIALLIENNIKVTFCNYYINAAATVDFHIAGSNTTLFSKHEWHEVLEYVSGVSKKVIRIDDEDLPDTVKVAFKALGIELCVQMISSDVDVGYIIIGEKRSGNDYTKEDMQLLEIIADEVAIAVQNNLQFNEISQFNITLQKKIEEATKELQKSNEKLQKLDEAKDEFISMASHQLRTPLTSVKGYISMILEGDAGPVNDTQKRFLDQAFLSSQRMVYLIADLLNVSRLKTGKFVIEANPTYLPDVVESEINQLQETAKARELELVFTKPAEFVTLNLDETKIRQVIMNFVDNAIYYTPRGGRITVALKQLKNSIEYTVTDTGIGVPKKDQHHLFTKFYRAANAKKSRPDGTGLGLYMAKKVVIAQGGAMIFKTTEGKGSTFGFTFPIPETANE
ncbi:hypothetical protein KC871_00705 [Candidatus Saccharibacteria bacterium]|nr:hypothetical protein [Candidatus Saccharibacteria bacterium]